MSSAFVELANDALNAALADLLCPRLESILTHRGPGHCMRLTDLNDQVMESACSRLRRDIPGANIFILSGQHQEPDPFRVTSTKLVELRNPDGENGLRPPLLVFIPASLRTSAEDSFGVGTFEDLSFTGIYQELANALLERVPAKLASSVRDIFDILLQTQWPFADQVARVRFLLTAVQNGIDGETLGASLYELSLIPDFKLFADIGAVGARVRRNLACVTELMASQKSNRGRIAALGLSDKDFEAKLLGFFEKYEIQEPEKWTAPIATDRNCWSLSFDKWNFRQELSLDKVGIANVETDLPLVQKEETDERLAGLIGQQVLVPKDRRKLSVTFEVNPHPAKVSGLEHFTVQVISQANGPVGKTKKVKVWTPSRLQCSVSLPSLNKVDFEEGWHFIRVLPWTADGDPIPLDSGAASDQTKRAHESEPFYVIPDGRLQEDPPQRAIPVEQSLEHARLRLQLTALADEHDPDEITVTSVGWAQSKGSKRISPQEVLHAKFGREGTVQIPVSRILKNIEQRILANPRHACGWRMQINLDTAESPSEVALALPATSAMQSFQAAREALFSHLKGKDGDLTVEAFSFAGATKVCMEYAEAYRDLVRSISRQAETTTGTERQQHLRMLRNILSVDSVHVVLTDFRGRHREALLASPTHPLRALWLSCWAVLGKDWIGRLRSGSRDHLAAVRKALLEDLRPSHFPVGIPVEDGRVFTLIDGLGMFWDLYAPTRLENPRGLLAEVSQALGLPEPASSTSDITGDTIADKIERYLSQHPYVRELSLNAFNPGSGNLLADALLALQQRRDYSDLRYNLRLFAPDPDSPTLGDAIELLVRPETTVNEAADAFAVSSGSHLFSKLNVAKHSLEDFHASIADYPAHISILLDVFPPEDLAVKEVQTGVCSLFGLVQEFETTFIDDDSGTAWSKHPIVGTALPGLEDPACFDLLSSLSKTLCYATSSVASSGASFRAVPVVTLGLSVPERELIYEVHQISDWVFTVDRTMGIEFFDHGGRKNRPDYLIDFVPGKRSQADHNLIISSRSHEELEAMLKPVLLEHGLSADGDQAFQLLAHLRSLSGQLALKLISAPTQQAEALGLALARLYLEYQGALLNQVIVPLDAHINLYRSSGDADDVMEAISLQRTDLALFDLDLAARTITCNLVEVKCYSQVGDFSAYNQLKERISAQINQSERILQRHFDPDLRKPDRPDRLLKSAELATILRFYLERSVRYGIIDGAAAQETAAFLRSIETGYSLQFRRSALVFDFDKAGTEPSEMEVGIEFHRVGKDLIKALLENCRRPASLETSQEGATQSLSEQFIATVPKLESAAFISPRRERSTSLASTELGRMSDTDATGSGQPADEAAAGHPGNTEPPLVAAQAPADANVPDEAQAPEGNAAHSDPANPDLAIQQIPTEIEATKGAAERRSTGLKYDVILGTGGTSPQYGIIGEAAGRKIALDLNGTHTMSLFGVQGGGKSYTLGTVIEMASAPIRNINVLPSPLATVIFHYSPTQDYAPEFTSMVRANSVAEERESLRNRYGAEPQALKDVILLAPADKVAARKVEYPDIEVFPIAFAASELKAAHWKFLMGAIGSQSMYMRQINLIMRGLRNGLTLEGIRTGIDNSGLADHLKELARTRLQFATEYIDDTRRLQDLIRPSRLIIVDLRDEYIEKDEALGLFVVMLQIFSEATYAGKPFNKLVVFDEAHKYIENEDLVSGLVEVVREMRHKGTSIMVASQDPPSVPVSLIELSSQIIMHKFNSPAWLKHIQKANTALAELTSEKMSHLGTGEAYVWSSKASDDAFTRGAVKIRCRPRVTEHGGSTKTAVGSSKGPQ